MISISMRKASQRVIQVGNGCEFVCYVWLRFCNQLLFQKRSFLKLKKIPFKSKEILLQICQSVKGSRTLQCKGDFLHFCNCVKWKNKTPVWGWAGVGRESVRLFFFVGCSMDIRCDSR